MPIRRRNFLKTLVLTATGAAIGCGDDEAARPDADTGLPSDTDPNDGGSDTDDASLDAAVDAPSDVSPGPTPIVDPARFPQSLASGDPTPDSVLLWTRLLLDAGQESATLFLEVAQDEAFAQRVPLESIFAAPLRVERAHDGCVKVRVRGLEPDTTYWYRFVTEASDGDAPRSTRAGRTRTAPSDDDARPVRFAFVSCQDYAGVYYNPYKRLVTEDLDFFVHLGDYVYETTGDPEFQRTDSDRKMRFGDTEGAIPLGTEENRYWAARSVDNYRDLYRTHRADPWLQAMHERFPMIAIQDDHEFTNDAWGVNGTYFNERVDEADPERRQNANQVWYEYMPVDMLDDPGFVYDRSVQPPNDLRIWRDLRWGAHLHLVMTDLRAFRPDHVIPESALPGGIAVTEDLLEAHHGGVPAWASPYVAWQDEPAWADAVRAWADANDYPLDRVDTHIAVRDLAQIVETFGTGELDVDDDGLPRGVRWGDCGKSSLFSSLGSRYLAVVDAHDVIADEAWRRSGGASERLMGDVQRAWFLDTMQRSEATWKVWCNEFCLLAKVVDVRPFDRLPDALRQRFYLSTEDWAGAMNERDALIDALADTPNVVAITGDIHAFFASAPFVRADPSRRIPEFVTSSISTGTFERLLLLRANSDPDLRAAGAAALALLVGDLLRDPDTRPNPELAHARINAHGYAVVELDDDAMRVNFTAFPQNLSIEDLPVEVARDDATVLRDRFEVRSGSPDVWMERDGTWQRWDAATGTWQTR